MVFCSYFEQLGTSAGKNHTLYAPSDFIPYERLFLFFCSENYFNTMQ